MMLALVVPAMAGDKVVEVVMQILPDATDVLPEKTGAYLVGVRLFAKHPLLAHRQSFECVKWL